VHQQITCKRFCLALISVLLVVIGGCKPRSPLVTMSPITTVSPFPTTSPTFTPSVSEKITFQGKLLFHSERNGGLNLFIYDGQTASLMPLTNGPGVRVEGDWSPDGTRIAYTSGIDDPNNFRIYTMNLDGSNERSLTGSVPGDSWAPDWSPDGTQVLFQTNRDGNFEIYVVRLSDLSQNNLTNHPANDSHPAWSPDGSKIAFASQRDTGKWQLYIMNADGSNPQRIHESTSNDMSPTWSKDGRYLLFSSDREKEKFHIFRLHIDSGDLVQLTTGDYDDIEPVWVDEDQFVAFSSNRHIYVEDPDWDIFVMKADGTNQVALVPAPGIDKHPSWSNRVP